MGRRRKGGWKGERMGRRKERERRKENERKGGRKEKGGKEGRKEIMWKSMIHAATRCYGQGSFFGRSIHDCRLIVESERH